MDVEDNKATLYSDIIGCVLDILAVLDKFAAEANAVDSVRWSSLLSLRSKLYATIARGKELLDGGETQS